MNAGDIMVSNVITIEPDALVSTAADLLLRNRISAVPVVDKDGKLVGIVSEGDLMRRPETGTERRRSVWLDVISSRRTAAAEFIKAHSRKVADVMTRDVITVTPLTPVSEVAALLERKRIKRVPVTIGGSVVGIVSRANLLQSLASLNDTNFQTTAPSDASIRKDVLSQLQKETWGRSPLLNVTVQNGTVDIWGVVESAEEQKAVQVLAEAVKGVRAVNNNTSVWPLTFDS